jgi:hypothetical protein
MSCAMAQKLLAGLQQHIASSKWQFKHCMNFGFLLSM